MKGKCKFLIFGYSSSIFVNLTNLDEIASEFVKLHEEERKNKEGLEAKVFDVALCQRLRSFQTEEIVSIVLKLLSTML